MIKRTIYLVILAIITVFCILLGVAIHTLDFATDWIGRKWTGSDAQTYVESNQDNSTPSQAINGEVEAFDSIVVEADVLELTVIKGDTYKIQTSVVNAREPKITVKNNTLSIRQNQPTGELHANQVECKVVVTVPEGVEMKKVYLDVDYGDSSLEDMNIVSFDAKLDMGQLKVKRCSFNYGEVELDMGNAEFDQVAFQDLEVNLDMGSATINCVENISGYDFDLSADVGTITVNGDGKMRHYETADLGIQELKVDCDMGSITINYPTNQAQPNSSNQLEVQPEQTTDNQL